MIRANSLSRIRQQVIVEPLIEPLKSFGFNYLKTANWFKRRRGIYDHRITCLLEYSPFSFNKEWDKFIIKFRIGGHIESPDFWKWCCKLNIGAINYFHQYVFEYNCVALFEKDLFMADDFFEPSKSQMFKQYMISRLSSNSGFSSPNLGDPILLDDIINNLENYIEKFNDLASPISLYKNKSGLWPEHLLLLIFEKKYDFAEQIVSEIKDYYLNSSIPPSKNKGLLRVT